jgi:hypothetical protein
MDYKDILLGFFAANILLSALLVISFLCAIKCRIRKLINGVYWIKSFSGKIKAPYIINKYQIPSMMFRIATCWLRSYPSIYIIGEMKCGTTALNEYLNQHPLIKLQTKQFVKEPHFFEGRSVFRDNFEDCPWLYKSFFDWAWCNTPYQIDATPQKLYLSWILKKIKYISPDAKIIICVRDPISRAISNYTMLVNRHQETRDINIVINEELMHPAATVTDESITNYIDGNDFIFPMLDHQYVSRGKYISGIDACTELFGKNVYILKQGDLWKTPQKTLDSICEFLNIPVIKNLKQIEKNKGFNHPLLNESTRTKLIDYYSVSNKLLYNKYGISFDQQ